MRVIARRGRETKRASGERANCDADGILTARAREKEKSVDEFDGRALSRILGRLQGCMFGLGAWTNQHREMLPGNARHNSASPPTSTITTIHIDPDS